MAAQHPVFLRRVSEGKVIVLTILDSETLGLKDGEDETFCMATTSTTIYSNNNPSMELLVESKMSAKEFVDRAQKDGYNLEYTTGQGLSGLVRSPFWFIRKFKSVYDLMGG
jgi:hypothetical protein